MGKIDFLMATTNKGKIEDFKTIFGGTSVRVWTMPDTLPEVVEDQPTLQGNAIKKATETALALGVPTMAEDSGLFVHALKGAPGVLSARFAGPGATDADRNNKILTAFHNVHDRTAVMVSAIAVAMPDGAVLFFKGRLPGCITLAPAGTHGFGYDTIFRPRGHNDTLAMMTHGQKNDISHRRLAAKELLGKVDMIADWMCAHP